MAERCRIWQVVVDRGIRTTTALYSATSRSKAMAEAWRAASDAWSISFRDFVEVARVRAYDGPVPDCYAYVRKAYGIDVVIGQRVSVRGERGGEVVHPGGSTASHVHVLLDGMGFALPVHPLDIVREARS